MPHKGPQSQAIVDINFFVSKPRLSKSVLTGLITGALIANIALALEPPKLSCKLPKNTNGAYACSDGVIDLKWKTDANSQFELQATNPVNPETFKHRYKGTDQSSVLSGLAEGTHHFRVRAIHADDSSGPWSENLTLEVTYMPASRVRLLLILGGIVVLATIGTITFGYLNHRGKEGEA